MEYHFPPQIYQPLLATSLLPDSRRPSVLELGTGTGLLPVLLHPLFSRFVASDRLENLKLVAKNLKTNDVLTTGAVAKLLSPTSSPKARKKTLKSEESPQLPVEIEEIDWESLPAWKAGQQVPLGMEFDLILAVDCIYNEHLTGPLVEALARYTGLNTTVWVVVELRSADVVCNRR